MSAGSVWRAIAREPLTWFALVAVALVAFDADGGDGAGVVVTAAEIDALLVDWSARTGRPPTPQERRALVDDYAAEGLWARYARELGLERGDRIVRARLRRKAEALAEAEAAPVTEDDLRSAFAKTADADADAPAGALRYTFTQTLLDGATTTLPTDLTAVPPAEITAVFGRGFAERLRALPPPPTTAEVDSPFGRHRVRLTAVTAAPAPGYEQARERLAAELSQERRHAAVQARLTQLRRRYGLRIEGEERGDD